MVWALARACLIAVVQLTCDADEDGGEFELRMETELPSDQVMHRLLRDGPLTAFLASEGVLYD